MLLAKRTFVSVIIGLGTLIIVPVAVVSAAAVTQGFTSTQSLPPGSLAATLKNKAGEVVAANTDNSNNIVGVVVTGDTAVLNINATAPVQVATSGVAEVFVTNLAGSIRAGDRITASPLSGVGMKANDSVKIVGIAEENFDASAQSKQQTITSRDGAKRQVEVGAIPVRVQAAYYSAPQEKTIIPPPFQQFSNAVAGKQVSPLRVIISFFVILAAIVSVSIMLFSAMKSSIISIGRNPLASKNIYKGVFQAFGAGAVILVVAVGGAYVIMRL